MTLSRIHNAYLILAGALLFGVLFAWFALKEKSTPEAVVHTPSSDIAVTVADTPSEWEKGLSGTASLPTGMGKLFIFDRPDLYGFWMKDMHYPLDIVWIDEAQTVVGVAAAVTPESYPEVFYPPAPVRYVLELNTGEAAIHSLASGVKINITKQDQKIFSDAK